MIEARAREYGAMISVEFAEGFLARRPPRIDDLVKAFEGIRARILTARMKIGITCYPTFGGSGVVATELGIALADRGDEVHFISYALPSRLDLPRERVHFHEVVAPTYPLFVSPPYTLALATKMAEVAAHANLDLLHVHYALPHAISAILAREMGTGQRRAAQGRHDAPRHRHHDRRPGPLLPADHALGHRPERRRHGRVAATCRTSRSASSACAARSRSSPTSSTRARYRPGRRLRRSPAPSPGPASRCSSHVSNFRPVKRVARRARPIFERVRRRSRRACS